MGYQIEKMSDKAEHKSTLTFHGLIVKHAEFFRSKAPLYEQKNILIPKAELWSVYNSIRGSRVTSDSRRGTQQAISIDCESDLWSERASSIDSGDCLVKHAQLALDPRICVDGLWRNEVAPQDTRSTLEQLAGSLARPGILSGVALIAFAVRYL